MGGEVLCPHPFELSVDREHALVREYFLKQEIGDKTIVIARILD
jgi:hypothetical protein